MTRCVLYILFLFCGFNFFATASAQNGTLSLNFGNYTVDWLVAEDQKSITFKVTVIGAPGWIGLGFTQNNTDMTESDLVIGQVNAMDKTKLDLADFWSLTEGIPKKDEISSIYYCKGSRDLENEITEMEFSRYLDTGDRAEDVVIPLDGIYVMWAYSGVDVLTSAGHSGGDRGYAHGKVAFNVSDPQDNPESTTLGNGQSGFNFHGTLLIISSLIFAFVVCK